MTNNQLIIGSNCALGVLLAKELVKHKYAESILLHDKNPIKVNENDVLVEVDLLDSDATKKVFKNVNIAYFLTTRIKENSYWKKNWPIIIVSVLNACRVNKIALVFYDNTCPYKPEHYSNIIEETPTREFGKNDFISVEIDSYLKNKFKSKEFNILIARSAACYGVGVSQSLFNNFIVKNISNSKKVYWLLDINKKYSLTLINDVAKSLAVLGNCLTSYNQVWHLPTDKAHTINELTEIIKNYAQKPIKVKILSRFMIRVLSYFSPIVKEKSASLHQFENDYEFNSYKFQKAFNIEPTPIKEGIKQFIKNYTAK